MKRNMKRIKEFRSFEINEGLLDDMKAKVKNGLLGFRKSPVLRKSEEVSQEVWNTKLNAYDAVSFTKKEVEFFEKFVKKNREFTTRKTINPLKASLNNDDSYIDIFKTGPSLGKYPNGTPAKGDDVRWINIIKLDDSWYLISDRKQNKHSQLGVFNTRTPAKYYICDEWEEVIEFLSNIINEKP